MEILKFCTIFIFSCRKVSRHGGLHGNMPLPPRSHGLHNTIVVIFNNLVAKAIGGFVCIFVYVSSPLNRLSQKQFSGRKVKIIIQKKIDSKNANYHRILTKTLHLPEP